MEKKECPGCALDVDAPEEICPFCGYEFPQQSRSVGIVVWLMILLLLLWVIL